MILEITEAQKTEIIQMKHWMPFRVVFGILSPSGDFQVKATYTDTTKSWAKKGYVVVKAC